MFKNRFMFLLVLIGAISLMSGCAVNRTSASLAPDTDLSKVKSIYVVKLPQDGRKINELIKAKLESRGYSVTTGPELPPPYKADAALTYADRWMWDITMYMLELTLTVRDPASSFPMAVGNSYHTSLTRKSPDEMVDEVLTNIFNAQKK